MWWKKRKIESTVKAVAYYRHSAQDRQENSIPIQREQVRKFAEDHQIEIIKEFADYGKSGLSTEGRDGFQEMFRMVCDSKMTFKYILVLDVSRWGRFQDVDLSAYYRGICKIYKREVVYISKGFPKKDDPMESIQLSFDGYRAAEYSRELSDKVFKGCVKIAQQGFRAGGPPPYGLNRLLLDEKRNPVQILKPGQRKSIQNQRVTLTPGDKDQETVVKRIFTDFVKNNQSPKAIADLLNHDGIPSPGAKKWNSGVIHSILRNELYIGTMIYNKTAQRLQARTTNNPHEHWIRTENAFPAIVEKNLFCQAQEILDSHEAEFRQKYSHEEMLAKLKEVYQQYGIVTARQISAREDMVSASTYTKHFSSLDMAFQRMFSDILEQTKETVMDHLGHQGRKVEKFEDYVVLDDSFSLTIQPSVPVPYGYGAYWTFRPDPRTEVDITLGVPLSNNGQYKILGYLAFPRMLMDRRNIKIYSSSDGKLDLFGYHDLDVVADALC